MDTKITGIINEGDTSGIKEWVEKQVGSVSDRKSDMADLKRELSQIRQTIDQMHKKIDRIEKILKTGTD